MMIIRPGWRATDLITWSALVGFFIAAVFIWPGQAVWAFVTLVLIGLIAWARLRPVRLEITESIVRARQGRWRGHPDMQAPRSEIRAIHYFPRMISFRGPDNKPIMMIDGNYTLRQMAKVAEVLGVPFYDHTRWLGTRKVKKGRLVYDPASPHPVS